MTTPSFKPKNITKRLLSALPDRAKLVVTKRYGLDKNRKGVNSKIISVN